MNTDFKELSHDVDLIARVKKFHDAAFKIEDIIKRVVDPTLYENLSNADKVKYNLLMSYTLNSVFWMYLRSEGIDPTKHKIKCENDRLKKSMLRAKQIHDKNTLMPRVNKEVAQRFVRNSLWEAKDKRRMHKDDIKKNESDASTS